MQAPAARAIADKYRGWSYFQADAEGLRLCQLAVARGDWVPILLQLIALNQVMMETTPKINHVPVEKRSLAWIVDCGTGEELDELGKLVELPRRTYGALSGIDHEPDSYYRVRLSHHPQVQLLLNYKLGAI